MGTKLFLAALVAVSTFTASGALAMDVDGPAKGSACDIASKTFVKEVGGEGDRVRVEISPERGPGVSFVIPYELREEAGDFPIGELNGLLPEVENRDMAHQYAKELGAWAILRKKDDHMKVFYQSPNGCVEAFSK